MSITVYPTQIISSVVAVRINGVDTALTGSLTGAATSAIISNISVTAQAGDDISIKMVCAASSTTADVQVMVNAI